MHTKREKDYTATDIYQRNTTSPGQCRMSQIMQSGGFTSANVVLSKYLKGFLVNDDNALTVGLQAIHATTPWSSICFAPYWSRRTQWPTHGASQKHHHTKYTTF